MKSRHAISLTLLFSILTPIRADSGCFEDSTYRLVDFETGEKVPWHQASAMTYPVKGKKFGNGVSLHSTSEHGEGTVYLTNQFFEDAKLSPPAGGQDIKMSTYHYYVPNSENAASLRGSGRDHIISDLSEKVAKSVKGSGTNKYFSKTNGTFELANFRQNGLQSLLEIPEFAIAQIAMKKKIPIEVHTDLVLLPEELQYNYAISKIAEQLAVQSSRPLEGGRESMNEEGKVKLHQKLELAAQLFYHNIGHGAVNPENLTADGKLVDMGHVTFGHPITSSAYRCTVCVSNRGGSADGSMINILDHYFKQPRSQREMIFDGSGNSYWSQNNSYSGKLGKRESEIFLDVILQNLSPSIKPTKLNNTQFHALDELLHERMIFIGSNKRKAFIGSQAQSESIDLPDGTRTSVSLEIAKILQKYQNRLLKLDRPFDDQYIPVRQAPSLRFIMQVAALKTWDPSRYLTLKKALTATIFAPEKRAFLRSLELFETAYESNGLTLERLKPLFEHQLPLDIMNARLQKAAQEIKTFEDAAPILRKTIDELMAPITTDFQEFYEIILEMAQDLSKNI